MEFNQTNNNAGDVVNVFSSGCGPRCVSLSPFDVHMVKGPPHLVSFLKVRCCLPLGHGGSHQGSDGSTWED